MGNGKPRALLLAPEPPYPVAGGGALRTASLLHYLAARYELDLLVFRWPFAPDPAAAIPTGLARRIAVIEMANGDGAIERGVMTTVQSIRKVAPLVDRFPSLKAAVKAKVQELGRSASRRTRDARRLIGRTPPLLDTFAGFEHQIEAAIAGEQYEVGVIEHFWCARYQEQISNACRRTVLDLHNIESVLHERCAAAERKPHAFTHRIFAAAAAELERQWLPRFSEILTASERDACLLQKRVPGARVSIYSNSIPAPPPVAALPAPPTPTEPAIVFSANFEYHPNVTAVRYFRHEIWPLLLEHWPNLTWKLLGKNPHVVKNWTRGDPRIQVTGPVCDAVSELARAHVAVVPLLSGSGTRLKILEAWAAGLPVVSTSIGAEGLPVEEGKHLLIADSAEAFVQAISRLLKDAPLRRKLGCAGRELLEEEFTWEKAWRMLEL